MRRLLLGAGLLCGWLAQRNYRALPVLDEEETSPDMRRVTIIVPARNEASRLPELLRSVAVVDYPDYEVLVVDDGSTDGTAAVAEAHGVRVLRLDELPMGWSGKCFACQAGADASKSEWLLFTDADTVHAPSSLRQAVALASRTGAGLVSLLAQQRCHSFWERLLLPYAYALYFVGAYRVNQPGGTSVANGQYMLFRREVYERLGGHRAVGGSLIEDVALARLAARTGAQVVLARGEHVLQVRMYEDLGSLWEGLTKNAARFIAASPRAGAATVAATVVFNAMILAALRPGRTPVRAALLAVPAVALLPWMDRFGVTRTYALLYPAAAAVFQLLAFDSVRRAIVPGQASWKGRAY